MMATPTLSSQLRVRLKWELTGGAFHGLLARLGPDPIAAGEAYEHLRRALLKFFSWHQVAEAESAVDDTLDRVARRLAAGHVIEDIPAFAYGVARLVRLERQRQAAATPAVCDGCLVAQPVTPELQEAEERDACLQRCLAELSRDDRDLIVAYYVGTGRDRINGRAQLAAALGVSENALRLRARRLRDRLRVRAAQFLEQGGSAELVSPHRH
jgi:DNA-directed RNA polymerase specialized sigma24 family protein